MSFLQVAASIQWHFCKNKALLQKRHALSLGRIAQVLFSGFITWLHTSSMPWHLPGAMKYGSRVDISLRALCCFLPPSLFIFGASVLIYCAFFNAVLSADSFNRRGHAVLRNYAKHYSRHKAKLVKILFFAMHCTQSHTVLTFRVHLPHTRFRMMSIK